LLAAERTSYFPGIISCITDDVDDDDDDDNNNNNNNNNNLLIYKFCYVVKEIIKISISDTVASKNLDEFVSKYHVKN
jgi:hypothetical protein